MKRTAVLLAFLLAACTTAQTSPAEDQQPQIAQAKATRPASNGPEKPFYRTGLTKVDLSGLDPAATERALKLLNGNGCDCGCGMTIAQCRVEDKSCNRSPVLAAAIVNAIRSGQTDQQAVAAYKKLTTRQDVPRQGGAQAATPVPVKQIPIDGSPTLGPDDAKVTVITFEDFQCPYCARAVPIGKQLVSTFPNDVKLVYKHYPLSFHNNAKRAAVASVAAQRQNKFWEFHDLLFANQRALDDASLRRYAQSLGLDMAAFDAAIRDAATTSFVDGETRHALEAGVRGTPSFFVNGVESPGYDFNTLKTLVQAALSGGDVSKVAGDLNAARQARIAAARNQRPQIDYNTVYQIDTSGSPSKGPADAPVVIVGFSDYQ